MHRHKSNLIKVQIPSGILKKYAQKNKSAKPQGVSLKINAENKSAKPGDFIKHMHRNKSAKPQDTSNKCRNKFAILQNLSVFN